MAVVAGAAATLKLQPQLAGLRHNDGCDEYYTGRETLPPPSDVTRKRFIFPVLSVLIIFTIGGMIWLAYLIQHGL